jgi:hypothetical protein
MPPGGCVRAAGSSAGDYGPTHSASLPRATSGHAAEERDERASPHSITSSARASSDGGRMPERPRGLEVDD